MRRNLFHDICAQESSGARPAFEFLRTTAMAKRVGRSVPIPAGLAKSAVARGRLTFVGYCIADKICRGSNDHSSYSILKPDRTAIWPGYIWLIASPWWTFICVTYAATSCWWAGDLDFRTGS